jgi:hypothetical protein
MSVTRGRRSPKTNIRSVAESYSNLSRARTTIGQMLDPLSDLRLLAEQATLIRFSKMRSNFPSAPEIPPASCEEPQCWGLG